MGNKTCLIFTGCWMSVIWSGDLGEQRKGPQMTWFKLYCERVHRASLMEGTLQFWKEELPWAGNQRGDQREWICILSPSLCLFCCLAYRVIIIIFLNSIYMSLFLSFMFFPTSFRRQWAAFLGTWCPLPAFRSYFVEFTQRSNVLLMNLLGRKWSPRPISPPSSPNNI